MGQEQRDRPTSRGASLYMGRHTGKTVPCSCYGRVSGLYQGEGSITMGLICITGGRECDGCMDCQDVEPPAIAAL